MAEQEVVWNVERVGDEPREFAAADGTVYTGGIEYKLLKDAWLRFGKPSGFGLDLKSALAYYHSNPGDYAEREAFVTNEQGGRQHAIPYRFDALDPVAMLELAALRQYAIETIGYEKDNWLKIPLDDHLNHAIAHIYQYWKAREDTTPQAVFEDHLVHAFCRLMFAVRMHHEQ